MYFTNKQNKTKMSSESQSTCPPPHLSFPPKVQAPITIFYSQSVVLGGQSFSSKSKIYAIVENTAQ